MEEDPPVKGPETPILMGSAAKAKPERLMTAADRARWDANLAKLNFMLSPYLKNRSIDAAQSFS
jgi:hypothetical protein